MARDIISDSIPPEPQAATARPEQASLTAARSSEPQAQQYALAEAFPSWDLIPAVPFVRRVK